MKNRNVLQRDFDHVAQILPIIGTEVARYTRYAWTPSAAGPLARQKGYLYEIARNIADYDAIVMYCTPSQMVPEYYLVGERIEEGKKVRVALAGLSDLSARALIREAKRISMWRHMRKADGNISSVVALSIVGALSFVASIRALISPETAPMSFGELIGVSIVCLAAFLWVRVEVKQNHRKFRDALPQL